MPRLTRQELYDLVWANPVRTVAGELGLSDVGLKKICTRFDIPVPHRGYWARLAAGQRVHQSPLPPRGPGMPELAFGEARSSYRWPPDPAAELAEPEPVEPVFEESLDAVEARIRKTVGKLASTHALSDPHPQLRRLIAKDDDRRRKHAGSGYSWDAPVFDAPFEQRRLRIINTLFWGLTRAGAKPSLSGQAARGLSVGIGGQNIHFQLDHPGAKRSRWNDEQVHGGKVDTLRLEIPTLVDEGRPAAWSDVEGRKLESQLTEIVVMLHLAAEAQYRRGALHSYKYTLESREKARVGLIRLREEAERKERERLAELERQRRERLLGYARDHRAAEDVRAFLAIVESKAEARAGVSEWLNWARAVADRLDPLTRMAFLAGELADPSDRATGNEQASET